MKKLLEFVGDALIFVSILFILFLFWMATGCETVNDYTSQRDAGPACTECRQNSDCEAKMFCSENCCVAGCQEDRDCPDDYVCQNGKCQAPSPECYRNSDCSSGKYCKNSTCVADCVKDIDCSADEICDMTVGQCKVNPPPDCIPENEICDGKDNDCDSFVDEELTQSCSTSCGAGIETCVAGVWANCTAPKPADEICDGKDNDCDGDVDEALYKACETSCDKGFETCVAGTFQDCTAPQPETEVCDGRDNDCDGTKDEGCECRIGESRKCGPETDAGECQFGIQVCVSGAWGKCMNAIEPVTETCDGKDNNCDGKIDEGLFGDELFARTCFTSCGFGIEICTNGTWGDCNAPQPQTEVCDGEDNDCDGEIDEGVKNACSICGPEPVEVCNGQDDDCDGQIDDGCRCPGEGLTQNCSSNVGICVTGTQTCTNGEWTKCSGIVAEQTDSCDGKDNNCNGKTDENFDVGVECSVGVGECKRTGVKVCKDTTSTKCNVTAGQSTDEVCDGKDNDCDGEIDETFGKITCGTGICQRRVYACVEGEVQVCTPGAPVAEACSNSLDDDCDGQTDEGCPPPTPPELTATYQDVNATTFVWYDDNKNVSGKGTVKAPAEGRCWLDVRSQKPDGTWTCGGTGFTFAISSGYFETGSFRDRHDPNGCNIEIYTGATPTDVAACKQSRQLINQTTGD